MTMNNSQNSQKKVRCSYCNRTITVDEIYSSYDIMSNLKKMCTEKDVNTRLQYFCSMECEVFFKIKSYTVAGIEKNQIVDLLLNDFQYSKNDILDIVDKYFMES